MSAVPQIELTGLVFTDANDIDAHFEDTPSDDADIQNHSDSESEISDDDDFDAPQGGPSFRRRSERGVGTSWKHRKPPTESEAEAALEELQNLLRPKRNGDKQKRYKKCGIKGWALNALQEIKTFLHAFTGAKSKVRGQWMEASKQAAQFHGKTSKYSAEHLRSKTKEFIHSHDVPKSPYGAWNISKIDADEDLKQEISLFLQSKGKHIRS